MSEVLRYFGGIGFKYWNKGRGRIGIIPSWIRGNIVAITVPVVGTIRVHRKIKENFRRVFTEIKARGLSRYIDVYDFKTIGGTFVPRRKMWKDKYGLSTHAFGTAIDFNVRKGRRPHRMNYKGNSYQHPEITRIFEKNGFIWGGRFRFPDGMHYEFADLRKIALPPARPTFDLGAILDSIIRFIRKLLFLD